MGTARVYLNMINPPRLTHVNDPRCPQTPSHRTKFNLSYQPFSIYMVRSLFTIPLFQHGSLLRTRQLGRLVVLHRGEVRTSLR